MENNNNLPKLKPFGPGGQCLSPFTLFQQIPTVETENLTYIEFLMGVLNQLNNLINLYNQVAELVENYDNEIKDLQNAISVLQTTLNNTITTLTEAIVTGDATTLQAAKDYTDKEIAQIASGVGFSAGITAAEYDAMQLAALDYDDMEITAKEYDRYGKIFFFGDVSTIYLQFRSSFTADALGTIFDLANPPVIPGRRYQFEISLGTFSLNSNADAHLEIVGTNTLGNTLPITVPSGGSSTVVGKFDVTPTVVRLMSGENQITGSNAYIKIKPLGEA